MMNIIRGDDFGATDVMHFFVRKPHNGFADEVTKQC
jgi:hypothetical protein